MDKTMEVSTRSEGKVQVVSPVGDVDMSSSPQLLDHLREVQRGRPSRLVVDLSGVEYMDSSGVATLVETLKAARKDQTDLLLCGLNERVRSIFEIARLDTVFGIVPDVQSALTG